jgi:hypothetical protein
MVFLIRMESMVVPLIGSEGSGLATLNEALSNVVHRISDQATVCRLNKALQSEDVACFSTLRAALN